VTLHTSLSGRTWFYHAHARGRYHQSVHQVWSA